MRHLADPRHHRAAPRLVARTGTGAWRRAVPARILRRRVSPGRPRREDGFTLLELLVVIVIIGLLIGLVAPAVLHQLGNARVSVAKQSIARLGSVLDLYRLDVGSYPTSDQGLEALLQKPADVDSWNGPYLQGNKLPVDPWNHPYLYRNPGQRQGLAYDLCSHGPDDTQGAPGQAGMICNQ